MVGKYRVAELRNEEESRCQEVFEGSSGMDHEAVG